MENNLDTPKFLGIKLTKILESEFTDKPKTRKMIIGRWPSDSIVKKVLLLTKTIKPSSGALEFISSYF